MERYELGSNFLNLWSRPYCKISPERGQVLRNRSGILRKCAAYLQFALPACLVLDAGKVQELVELRQAEGHQHGAKAVVVHGAGHPHALHDQEDRPAAPGSPSPRPSVEAEGSLPVTAARFRAASEVSRVPFSRGQAIPEVEVEVAEAGTLQAIFLFIELNGFLLCHKFFWQKISQVCHFL